VIYSVFDCGHGPVMDLHYTPSQTGLYVPTCRWLSVAFCQSQTILVPEMLSCTSFQLFCLLAVVTVCVESSPYRWPIWRKKSCTKGSFTCEVWQRADMKTLRFPLISERLLVYVVRLDYVLSILFSSGRGLHAWRFTSATLVN
jgi:hypothetical protein